MNSLRKWLYKPKKTDSSLLAQFYYADEELNLIAAELDSFDGRKDPERCTALVNQLRFSQDKVLTYVENIMADVIPEQRASRDFRVKFPDDVLQENLAGQLWFGAECLAAGSSIMNREVESASMRPLAKAMTRHLDFLRSALRDQCLRNIHMYTDKIKEALTVFDKLFAEFELSYVSAMVPVKTMREYDILQEVAVLFCETVQRALDVSLLTQDLIDDCEPSLMFTIPRLAIVCGLMVFPEGPINPDMDPKQMSEMFRPFRVLLYKIRELLWTLTPDELWVLEKALCSNEEPDLSLIPKQRPASFNTYPVLSHMLDHSVSIENMDDFCDVGVQTDDDVKSYDPSPHEVDLELDFPLESQEDVSIKTVISNPEMESESNLETEEEDQCGECLTIQNVNGGVRHQESQDSGMPSEHGSMQDCRPSENTRPTTYRRLRHSASWPETRRTNIVRHTSQSALLDSYPNMSQDLLSSTVRMQSSKSEGESLQKPPTRTLHRSQEFNVGLPANSVNGQLEENENNGLRSQRVIYTSDCFDMDETDVEPASQISYVTDTLNATFPVDNSSEACDNSEESSALKNVPAERNGAINKMGNNTSFKSTMSSSALCNTSMDSASSTIESLTESLTSSGSPRKRTLCEIASEARNSSSSSSDGRHMHNSEQGHRNANQASDGTRQLNKHIRRRGREGRQNPKESHESSDTSSYNSECTDDEEVVMAIRAAEDAAKHEARSKFKNSTDLIHRLFVCVSGVADQLQTNYAADLRHILKLVFDTHASTDEEIPPVSTNKKIQTLPDPPITTDNTNVSSHSQDADNTSNEEPPTWVPDEESPHCTTCKVPFTFVRRRHHCRNCGRVFCGRCSANTVPLPHYGHTKPVRVCNHCFMFQVTPFTVAD